MATHTASQAVRDKEALSFINIAYHGSEPAVLHGNRVGSWPQKPESTRSFWGSIAVPAVSRINVSDDMITSPGEREEMKLESG